MIKTVMVTGANAGLGKEGARQLALKNDIEKIYLACRSEEKALRAKRELETATGKSVFEIVIVDVSDLDSVRNAVNNLNDTLDALVMNAGGLGGQRFMEKTASGTTQMFASNLLGHVLLAEDLIKQSKLKGTALYAGSEAAVGAPKMGIKQPVLQSGSVEEFIAIADGSRFSSNPSDMDVYALVKLTGALWMATLARLYPHIRFITMSPGNTSGTQIMNDVAPVKKFIFTKIVLKLLPLFNLVHDAETGVRRYLDGLYNQSYKSGVFYGSKAKKLTGPRN